MILVGEVLDRTPQFFHLAPLLAVVLLLLALHDLDAVRQLEERVGDVFIGCVHPGAGVVSQGAASMAFGRWLRVVGSRLDAASLVLGQGSVVGAHKPPCGAALLTPCKVRRWVGDSSAAGLGTIGKLPTTLSSRKRGAKKLVPYKTLSIHPRRLLCCGRLWATARLFYSLVEVI